MKAKQKRGSLLLLGLEAFDFFEDDFEFVLVDICSGGREVVGAHD